MSVEEAAGTGSEGAEEDSSLTSLDYDFSLAADFDHQAWPILLVESDPALRRQFKSDFGRHFTVHGVASGEEARKWFKEREYAVVVANLDLDDVPGDNLLAELAEQRSGSLRVVLSDESDQHRLLRAVNQARTYAFITSPWVVAEMTMTLRRAVERYALDQHNRGLLKKLKEERRGLAAQVEEQTRALREANERLRALAVSDGLTGIYNHRYFQERLKHEIGVARRYDKPMSLMLLDLDHFKAYNDTLGHPQGDLLIREVASLLTSTVREVDLVARYGGDEFAIAMPRAEKGSAVILAERIRKVVSGGAFELVKTIPGGRITVSIGVATFPDDGASADEVLASADRALYRAKKAGRDRVDLAQGFEVGAGTADRDADFHLLVEEDGMTHNLTPRPGVLKTLQHLLSDSDAMREILEDGDTMEHPASVPDLGPGGPHQLMADILDED